MREILLEIHLEPLPEGGFLATSEELPGPVSGHNGEGIVAASYRLMRKPAPLICFSTSSSVDQLISPGIECCNAA